LWRWGLDDPNARPRPELRTLLPQRFGTGSNWAEAFAVGHFRAVLRESNGNSWVSPPLGTVQAGTLLEGSTGKVHVQRMPAFDDYFALAEIFGSQGAFVVGIHRDGTFRVAAAPAIDRNGRINHTGGLTSVAAVLDAQTNWIAVAANPSQAVTLRSDGTLWKWTFPKHSSVPLTAARSVQLSRHSDWIGLAPTTGAVALAADGSVWLWPLQLGTHYPPPYILMAPSRKPWRLTEISWPVER